MLTVANLQGSSAKSSGRSALSGIGLVATFGERVKEARGFARGPAGKSWSQDALARALGYTRNAIEGWENRGVIPSAPVIEQTALLLGVSAEWLRGETDSPAPRDVTDDRPFVREDAREPYSPNPRSRRRLPPRAYERVYGYLRELEDAGATHEQLDEAERVMVDGAYNKLNSRDVRERSDEEMIGDIDMAWAFIRDLLRRENLKLK